MAIDSVASSTNAAAVNVATSRAQQQPESQQPKVKAERTETSNQAVSKAVKEAGPSVNANGQTIGTTISVKA